MGNLIIAQTPYIAMKYKHGDRFRDAHSAFVITEVEEAEGLIWYWTFDSKGAIGLVLEKYLDVLVSGWSTANVIPLHKQQIGMKLKRV